MGAAFTLEEQQLIRKDLKKVARKYLSTIGMRKTSVDQIVADVGISKGAFYKFYETKEHLFYAVMEDIHEEIYTGTAKILKDPTLTSPLERLENAFLYAYQILTETSMLTFMTNELPYMMRKLSPTLINAHMQSDSNNITMFLTGADIHLNYSPDFIGSLIRGIISISREKAVVGEEYVDDVIRFLIHTTCVKLLEDATFDS